MEIRSIESFLPYYANVRARTRKLVQLIPAGQVEWRPAAGRFSLGDLARHIAAVERYVFAENVRGKPSQYRGCGPELGATPEAILDFLDRAHAEAVEIFASLTPEQLNGKGLTPDGSPITVWKLLRALVEHEAHHRGQIYVYLALLGIDTPPLYGRTEPELRALSAGN